MENKMKNNVIEKTAVFNLIILDESGSMSSAWKQTITGCNETLNVARTLQKKHSDVQNSFVSIYAFQSGGTNPSRYLMKNQPTEKVQNITTEDYQPCGGTPLLDAIGSTLVDLRAVASTHTDSTAIVTIITDGWENSSVDYSWSQVASLISELKELGWTINFIGANIDVDQVANNLNIDNRMSFTSDAEGTNEMFQTFHDCCLAYEESRICEERNMSQSERLKHRISKNGDFFM